MQMTTHPWGLVAIIVGLAGLPTAAKADLVCEADIQPLNFGAISVIDGDGLQTSGLVKISCTGSNSGATVRACLSIRSGSVDSGLNLTPRFMADAGAEAKLGYQLTSQKPLSAGGTTWDTVEFAVPLGLERYELETYIFAEITSSGAQVTVGNYQSNFVSDMDVSLLFGETSCDTPGRVSAFTVTAEVNSSCSIKSVTNMDFGNIPMSVHMPVDQTAVITVTCTKALPYNVGLGQGNGASTGHDRHMMNGNVQLAYNLYQNNARTKVWGANGLDVFGDGTEQNLTVYGRILGEQQAVVGHYKDTVIVEITY